MIFGSVCSGIEATSVAWHPLGWETEFVSEVAPFPSAVLKHRFPGVPNLGDFTTIRDTPSGRGLDLLVGGTPCQSFSVAGFGGGLDDDRGNLALEFVRLADRLKPRWLVWENVPGVLSCNGGRDFGSILGALVKLGYGFAYRVLDAQFYGVPQRRRRVFVVGYLGDWRRAAAVLFEQASLHRDPEPRRKKANQVAGTLGGGSGGRGRCNDLERSGAFIPSVDPGFALMRRTHKGGDPTMETYAISLRGREGGATAEVGGNVANALRTASGGGSREHVLAPIAFSSKDYGGDAGPLSPTLRAGNFKDSHANSGAPPAIACVTGQIAHTLDTSGTVTEDGSGRGVPVLNVGQYRVRRLTPRECERLQGFPDDWTLVPWPKSRGPYNGMAPDGPRYAAVGNSMAVPVMAWIGCRIEAVDLLPNCAPANPTPLSLPSEHT